MTVFRYHNCNKKTEAIKHLTGTYKSFAPETNKPIPADKVKSFLILFNKIAREKGGIAAACNFAGVSESTHTHLIQKRLGASCARKILEAYKKL